MNKDQRFKIGWDVAEYEMMTADIQIAYIQAERIITFLSSQPVN